MTAPIAPVGLTSGEVLPGIYVEVNFAQGPAIGSGLRRSILVVANKTAAGSATPDTQIYGPDTAVPLQTEPQMILLGGPGSEAHRMFRIMAKITGEGNMPPVYWIFVTESAGAKATGTITIATTATGPGTLRIWVGDESVDAGINTGDTPTVIATAAVSKVNEKTHWPCTASNLAGVITLTWKQNGLRGNWGRYMAAILAPTSIGTTTTATTDTFFTGGAASDSNTTALATIAGRWFYYNVSAAEDAAQVGAYSSQIATKSLALNGMRERLVFASTDTPANAITVGVGINNPLAEMVHSEKSPHTPAEIAAHNAMIYALEEADELGFTTNFIGYGNSTKTQPKWKLQASRVPAAWPTPATQRSLLQNGISPIAVSGVGRTYLVDRFTTKSLNGAVAETRIREAHKVTISHRFADALEARVRAGGEGKVIMDDPPNGEPPLPGSYSPRDGKMALYQTLNEFAGAAKIQSGINPETGVDRLDEQKNASIVQRETNPSSRMGFRAPIQTADNFRQAAIIVDQVA